MNRNCRARSVQNRQRLSFKPQTFKAPVQVTVKPLATPNIPTKKFAEDYSMVFPTGSWGIWYSRTLKARYSHNQRQKRKRQRH